jgi:hypothetical protein
MLYVLCIARIRANIFKLMGVGGHAMVHLHIAAGFWWLKGGTHLSENNVKSNSNTA